MNQPHIGQIISLRDKDKPFRDWPRGMIYRLEAQRYFNGLYDQFETQMVASVVTVTGETSEVYL